MQLLKVCQICNQGTKQSRKDGEYDVTTKLCIKINGGNEKRLTSMLGQYNFSVPPSIFYYYLSVYSILVAAGIIFFTVRYNMITMENQVLDIFEKKVTHIFPLKLLKFKNY